MLTRAVKNGKCEKRKYANNEDNPLFKEFQKLCLNYNENDKKQITKFFNDIENDLVKKLTFKEYQEFMFLCLKFIDHNDLLYLIKCIKLIDSPCNMIFRYGIKYGKIDFIKPFELTLEMIFTGMDDAIENAHDHIIKYLYDYYILKYQQSTFDINYFYYCFKKSCRTKNMKSVTVLHEIIKEINNVIIEQNKHNATEVNKTYQNELHIGFEFAFKRNQFQNCTFILNIEPSVSSFLNYPKDKKKIILLLELTKVENIKFMQGFNIMKNDLLDIKNKRKEVLIQLAPLINDLCNMIASYLLF